MNLKVYYQGPYNHFCVQVWVYVAVNVGRLSLIPEKRLGIRVER